MTNKEVIEQLEWIKKRISEITYSPESFEALNLAIGAIKRDFDDKCCGECDVCGFVKDEGGNRACGLIDNAPTVEQNWKFYFDHGYKQAIIDGKTNFSRPKGEWKVIGRNVLNNIWHVFCPKCNCDMFTEFTSYCPNCGEPKKEINIAELNMRGEEDVT